MAGKQTAVLGIYPDYPSVEKVYYTPTDRGTEAALRAYLDNVRKVRGQSTEASET